MATATASAFKGSLAGLIPVVVGLLALWVIVTQGRKALQATAQQAANAASTAANAPLQLFRDPKADSRTVGTQAWVSNQIDGIERWLGLKTVDPLRVYDGNRAPDPDTIDYTPDGIPIIATGVTGYAGG